MNFASHEDSTIRACIDAGKSASDCAKLLKRSKNSVISRARTLELNFKPVSLTPVPEETATRPAFAFDAPKSDPCTFMGLTRCRCRWPLDLDGDEQFYCGAVTPDRNYCDAHHAIAHIPTKKISDATLTKLADFFGGGKHRRTGNHAGAEQTVVGAIANFKAHGGFGKEGQYDNVRKALGVKL